MRLARSRVIVAAASVKRAIMNMVVHAYDIFFYLSSWSTVSYLWSDQRRYLLALVGALLAATARGLARLPRRRHARAAPLGGAGPAALRIACLVRRPRQGRAAPHAVLLREPLRLVRSMRPGARRIEALWRGALLEAAPRARWRATRFTIPARLRRRRQAAAHHPDPSRNRWCSRRCFRRCATTTRSTRSFAPTTISSIRLRVETYGGASWLTEFSLLAGVSTHAFGGMRQFVQTFTQNKLKDTLPQALGALRLPQRRVLPDDAQLRVQRPVLHLDRAQGDLRHAARRAPRPPRSATASTTATRMAEMERHFKSSRKPLLHVHPDHVGALALRLQVSSRRSTCPAARRAPNPEMHEYLRRVSMAKIDFDFLMRDLQRRFPRRAVPDRALRRPSSDGHAHAARLRQRHGGRGRGAAVRTRSASSPTTPRAASTIACRRLPPVRDRWMCAYLGTVMPGPGRPAALGLPSRAQTPDDRCKGATTACKQREEILAFHRRLIDSGVMAAR